MTDKKLTKNQKKVLNRLRRERVIYWSSTNRAETRSLNILTKKRLIRRYGPDENKPGVHWTIGYLIEDILK